MLSAGFEPRLSGVRSDRWSTHHFTCTVHFRLFIFSISLLSSLFNPIKKVFSQLVSQLVSCHFQTNKKGFSKNYFYFSLNGTRVAKLLLLEISFKRAITGILFERFCFFKHQYIFTNNKAKTIHLPIFSPIDRWLLSAVVQAVLMIKQIYFVYLNNEHISNLLF